MYITFYKAPKNFFSGCNPTKWERHQEGWIVSLHWGVNYDAAQSFVLNVINWKSPCLADLPSEWFLRNLQRTQGRDMPSSVYEEKSQALLIPIARPEVSKAVLQGVSRVFICPVILPPCCPLNLPYKLNPFFAALQTTVPCTQSPEYYWTQYTALYKLHWTELGTASRGSAQSWQPGQNGGQPGLKLVELQ